MNKKQPILQITDLHASVQGKEILRGINLTLKAGTIVALMGPNASGKSTLAHVLMGNQAYEVTKGKVSLNNVSLLKLDTPERAKIGLFLSFQNPVEVPGINLLEFLHTAFITQCTKGGAGEFDSLLKKSCGTLRLSEHVLDRALHEGFSGGEKKRSEMLQLAMLRPKIAILDEVDSGLDVDALEILSQCIRNMAKQGTGFLVISHSPRLLNKLAPKGVHIMKQGRIIASGDTSLVRQIERNGYENMGS